MDHEETYEYPADGPWSTILRAFDRTIFFPRQAGALPRTEWRLPSGAIVVDDLREGSIVRLDWRADADLQNVKPKGRPLGDRAIMKRQAENRPWFVFWYLEHYNEVDQLSSSTLRLVEHHVGQERLSAFEFDENGLSLPSAGSR